MKSSSVTTSWKDIPPIPTSEEFIDVVLSRTQRRLPTQIRSGFKISRIRAFYTRKVKFTQETFDEKFSIILSSFPRLQDIHPFHRDLLNTLYDADHFKIALGQLSTAKHLMENICRDYVRLLKYSQSLFQCKQLKRAALGRMATLTKRLKEPLLYLDQVRQHLGRLPSIDPNTRTLLVCGMPNGGKSSFVKSVSRADVDVQPYAFTTKSLYVGHFDYNYLRFQVIDTPGILDGPLETRTAIEMQAVTALAHLRAAILFFLDVSEQCGYSVADQISLYRSIRPLFQNKLVFIVINKIDVKRLEDLDSEQQEEINGLVKSGGAQLLHISCNTQEGVQMAKNTACEQLVAERVSQKLKAGTSSSGAIGGRLADVMARIHVAMPMDGQTRQTFIPEGVKDLQKHDKDSAERRRLARDVEEENGGAGVYNVDLRADYLLKNPEWKHDSVPEIFEGMNVADYIDPEIDAKLAALEEEEERLEQEGFYDSDDDELEDEDEQDILQKAELIREKQTIIRSEARMKKRLNNRAIIPRPAMRKPLAEMTEALDVLGVDMTDVSKRVREQSRPRGRSVTRARSASVAADAMDVDTEQTPRERLRSKSRARSQSTVNRREDGVQDATARTKAERMAKLGQKKMNRNARQGEADRHIPATKPKHLFVGKRGMGKTNSR